MRKKIYKILPIIMAMLMLCSCGISTNIPSTESTTIVQSISQMEEYSGAPYVEINGNVPAFDTTSYTESFETYGELDDLGRCTSCIANIGTDIMPTEERGEIGSVKPTGWHTIKYDNVDGKYLYNRCHLIGYQLTAENANPQNLITGTRYLNVVGMLPFEDQVAEYVKETNNHVLYRVTPVFYGDELVARGVHMEALSLEDNGQGVSFNVYCYNVQPDIEIDYATGESKYVGNSSTVAQGEKQDFVINISTKKFHKPDCSALSNTKDKNKKAYYGNRDNLVANGYTPCGQCNP